MTLLLAIAGGSGSGKSTLAAALGARLGARATVVSEDWYYRDLAGEPGFDPAATDFDDPAVRDHGLLRDHLAALVRGEAVAAPRYAFARHAREPGRVRQEPAELVVVEGQHLLCAAELAALFHLRVWLEVPADIRLIRRLVRDQRERGRSVESILDQYLRTVRPGHERVSGISRARADLLVEDAPLGIGTPEPGALDALVARVLAHPRLQGLGGLRAQG